MKVDEAPVRRGLWPRVKQKTTIHGHVWLRAVIFGLGAYAAIHLLIVVIDHLKNWT